MITSQGKISESVIEQIVAIVKEGNYDYIAAHAVGIHEVTFMQWKRKGERILDELANEHEVTLSNLDELTANLSRLDRLYCRFVMRLKQAEAESEIDDIRELNTGSKMGWNRLIKRSRRSPDRWAERETMDVTVKAGIAYLETLQQALAKPALSTTLAILPPTESKNFTTATEPANVDAS